MFRIVVLIQANNTGISEVDIRRAFSECDRDKSGDLDMSEYCHLHTGLETDQELKLSKNKQKRRKIQKLEIKMKKMESEKKKIRRK